ASRRAAVTGKIVRFAITRNVLRVCMLSWPIASLMASDDDSRTFARVAAVIEHDLPVDDDRTDSDRVLKWFREGGAVGHGRRIEDHQIGGEAVSDQASIGEVKLPRRQTGHFVDGLLERDHVLFAHVLAEDAREGAEVARMRHARAERAAR